MSPKLPKLEPNRERAFIQCTHPGCKKVYWYDYQPYGLSCPVITKPCGHGVTERLYATSKTITKKEYLAAAVSP